MVVQTLRACCEVFPEAALRLRQIIIQIAAHHIPDIHQLFIIGMQRGQLLLIADDGLIEGLRDFLQQLGLDRAESILQRFQLKDLLPYHRFKQEQ